MKNTQPSILSDEELFQDLYRAILKKKSEYFKFHKRRIDNTINLTIGTIGQEEQLQFLEQERAKLNKQVFEGPDATHIKEKLNYKTFIKNELSHPALIKYARELVNDPKEREMFVSSMASRYLPPHIFAYLIERITIIKNHRGSIKVAKSGLYAPIIGKKKSKKKVNSDERTDFFLIYGEKVNDREKREKLVSLIYNHLIKAKLISKMPLQTFKMHFNGNQHDRLINWLGNQYDLIYLINALKSFMNDELYNTKHPSITTLSKHFLFNGSPININSLRVKASQENNKVSNRFSNIVKLIVNGLSTF